MVQTKNNFVRLLDDEDQNVGRLLATPDIWTRRAFQIYAHLRMAGGGGGLA